MANRKLTGIISPLIRKGAITIRFNPHEIMGINATASHLKTSGAPGDYISKPKKAFSIKGIRVEEKDTDFTIYSMDLEGYTITCPAWTETHLIVSWKFESDKKIEEISYLIEGEAVIRSAEEIAAGEILLASSGDARVIIKSLDTSHDAAAEELKDYLDEISGTTFEVVPAEEVILEEPRVAVVYLGDPNLAGITPSELGPDDFVVAAKPNPYILDTNDLIIAGGSSLAGFYGVTAVLETLGCGWYFPDENNLGEVLPEPSDLLVLTPPLPESGLIHRPNFRIRGVRGRKKSGDSAELGRQLWKWGRRNYQNVEVKKYRMRNEDDVPRLMPEKVQGEFGINAMAHSWQALVPVRYRYPEDDDPGLSILPLYKDDDFGIEVRINPWQMNAWKKLLEAPGIHTEEMVTWYEHKGIDRDTFDKWTQRRWMLCPFAAKTAEAIGEGIRELLSAVPSLKAIMIMPADTVPKCSCGECEAARAITTPLTWFQEYSTQILRVTNRVVDYLQRNYPDLMNSHSDLLFLSAAYNHYLATPPDTDPLPTSRVNITFMRSREHNHALADPASILNASVYNYWYLQWLERTRIGQNKMLLYEYYDKTAWLGLPWPIIHSIRRDIPRFHIDGLLGLWSQYRSNFATNGLGYYIAARLLWDRNADVDELSEKYCIQLFGPRAGMHILKYHRELEQAAEDSGLEFVGDKTSSPEWEIIRLFSYELLQKLKVHLESARAVYETDAATTTPERAARWDKCIEGLESGWRYTSLMVCWIRSTYYNDKYKGIESWLDGTIVSFSEFIEEEEITTYRDLKETIEDLLNSGVPWIEEQKYITDILSKRGINFNSWDDDASRLFINEYPCDELYNLDNNDIVTLINNMLRGATLNEDENAILKLLNCPAVTCDRLRIIVDSIGLSRLQSNFHGRQFYELQVLLERCDII